jgi:hypothetical protein
MAPGQPRLEVGRPVDANVCVISWKYNQANIIIEFCFFLSSILTVLVLASDSVYTFRAHGSE